VTPLLEAIGLQKASHDSARLADIHFTLRPGEAAVLIGPRSVGKSTLLLMLGGFLKPDGGQLHLLGHRVPFENADACAALRRRHIGFVGQRAPIPSRVTIEQNLAEVAQRSGFGPAAACDRARELLFRVGLAAQLEKYPTDLDRTQLQCLGVAHALLLRPAVLLADDPTAGVNRAQAEKLIRLLLAQTRVAGAALLMATSDDRLASRFDRILSLDAGRLHDSSAFGPAPSPGGSLAGLKARPGHAFAPASR
jgi:putative ABC transport system ATP-binding protein